MILKGFIVPGKPHPLLASEQNQGWGKLRQAFEKVAKEIEALKPDLILIYSTQWLSVIGHQIQADPSPEWVHVDPEWHELGRMPYSFRMDAEFAKSYEECAKKRGLHARRVNYRGFPIDTGSVVALKLLNPKNSFLASIVSCNMYADRAETLVLGKAARDAIFQSKLRVVPVLVTSLSNRIFTNWISPLEDRIHSPKDEEWNQKVLELLGAGRLEDVSQLAREFSAQAHGEQKMKGLWWLAALMGQTNHYRGEVYEYQPIWGSGAALVGLTPSETAGYEREFDEEDVEVFTGEDQILHTEGQLPTKLESQKRVLSEDLIQTKKAPAPVGAYPHARRNGELLYLSGIGPRSPLDNSIPGGPTEDLKGNPLEYDVQAQTEAVIENIKAILEASGSSLDKVIDVSVFLINMKRDFAKFNEVYKKHFQSIQATRTTVEVKSLPTPIAVEFKVIAKA